MIFRISISKLLKTARSGEEMRGAYPNSLLVSDYWCLTGSRTQQLLSILLIEFCVWLYCSMVLITRIVIFALNHDFALFLKTFLAIKFHSESPPHLVSYEFLSILCASQMYKNSKIDQIFRESYKNLETKSASRISKIIWPLLMAITPRKHNHFQRFFYLSFGSLDFS